MEITVALTAVLDESKTLTAQSVAIVAAEADSPLVELELAAYIGTG